MQHEYAPVKLDRCENFCNNIGMAIISPAEHVIKQFGTVSKLAALLGRNRSTVSRWTKSRAEGGCGGRIPTSAIRRILELAHDHNKDITPLDLIVGRAVKKAETLV